MLIYYIENTLTNRIYVGQTVQKFKKRMDSHLYYLKTDQHYNDHLQRSWNKYGEDAFEFKILEKGFESVDELNEAEQFWITSLCTLTPHGYNLTTGGINFLSSEETKQKIRDGVSKPVVKYSLSGEMLEIYDSIDQAGKDVGTSLNNIVTCLNGRTKTAGGYQWRRLENDPPNKISAVKSTNKRRGKPKKVAQYCLDGKLLKTYDSVNEAVEDLGRNITNVRIACRKKGSACAGFQLEYFEDEPLKKIEPTLSHAQKVNKDREKKVIKCDFEGNELEVYDNVKHAAEENGLYFNTIRCVCGGNYYKDNCGGFKWKYQK